MSYSTPPAVLSALGLTTYEPAAGSGSFLINPPFAMTESPLNTIHTVYHDRIVGLTVTAWPRNCCSWYLLFRRQKHSVLELNGKAVWYTFHQLPEWHTQPAGGWADFVWSPVGHHLIPPAALTAVEAWLMARAVVEVAS